MRPLFSLKEEDMATKKNEPVKAKKVRGFSGKTEKVMLFYDGVKYKDPVFVGVNGRGFLVQRGVEVEVPEEVAEVLRNSQKQDAHAASMIRNLSEEAKEIIE